MNDCKPLSEGAGLVRGQYGRAVWVYEYFPTINFRLKLVVLLAILVCHDTAKTFLSFFYSHGSYSFCF